MSTSFPLPPAEGGPTVVSASYDQTVDLLSIGFSEPVQWAGLTAGVFTAHGILGTSSTSLAAGADGPGTGFDLNFTAGSLLGALGTLDYSGLADQITSTATGLPLTAFTGFPMTIVT